MLDGTKRNVRNRVSTRNGSFSVERGMHLQEASSFEFLVRKLSWFFGLQGPSSLSPYLNECLRPDGVCLPPYVDSLSLVDVGRLSFSGGAQGCSHCSAWKKKRLPRGEETPNKRVCPQPVLEWRGDSFTSLDVGARYLTAAATDRCLQVHGDIHGLLGGAFSCNVSVVAAYENER